MLALPEGIEATGDTLEVRALAAWADEHQRTHSAQAKAIAERGLALARELDDQRGVGECLMILGNLAFNSDLEQAEAYYIAAQEAFERIRDEHRLIRNRINLANVYRHQGNLRQALTYDFDALEGLELINDIEGQARILNNIGSTYKSQGNLEEALRYYERALMLAEALGRPVIIISSLNGLSSILVKRGLYQEAEPILHRALALSEEQGLSSYMAGISSNLGLVFNKQGSYDRALPLLLTAEKLGKELGENGLLGAIYDELGKTYAGLGQHNEALGYANESLTIAQEMGLIAQQMVAHEGLSQIYKTIGDYEQALIHHEYYVAARDSVLNVEKAEIITEMQIRYETEEQQLAIERLEYENQIRLILLLAGLSGLLLLLGFLYNRYRLKQKANRLLEELYATKSRFFANISHEFRTPLTVILGELQDGLVGRFGVLSEKLTRQHQAMLRNTHYLQSLIDEVLDLNRLETGKLDVQLTPGDLVRSLLRVVEINAPLAGRNDIDLTFEHEARTCPRLYDDKKLDKIVGNLLSNALKFTHRNGSVRVTLRCKEHVEISVSDNGPGIPTEAQETIFERFSQVEDGSLHGGTGIGLALAKELAELHGGAITLESEPGKGSTFMVRLPLEETTLDDVQRTATLRGASAKRTGGAPNPQEEFFVGGDGADFSREYVTTKLGEAEPDRTTVLVIEDNDDVRAYVRRTLEGVYRVLETVDGEAGLQQAREALPDLIVSDVMLPGIDGYEFARRLKTDPSTECIPVVMLTARVGEEDQTEGYGSGAEVYITKPFMPETLRAAVGRLLEERCRLRRWLEEQVEEEGAHRNGHRTFRDRARTAVLEHLHEEGFGVEALASALNMTRFTLYHRFKAEVGATPSTFLQTLRLERARELLSNEASSVSEVAYAVGFNSLVAFSRAYSAHYGVPPSTHLTRLGSISG